MFVDDWARTSKRKAKILQPTLVLQKTLTRQTILFKQLQQNIGCDLRRSNKLVVSRTGCMMLRTNKRISAHLHPEGRKEVIYPYPTVVIGSFLGGHSLFPSHAYRQQKSSSTGSFPFYKKAGSTFKGKGAVALESR